VGDHIHRGSKTNLSLPPRKDCFEFDPAIKIAGGTQNKKGDQDQGGKQPSAGWAVFERKRIGFWAESTINLVQGKNHQRSGAAENGIVCLAGSLDS